MCAMPHHIQHIVLLQVFTSELYHLFAYLSYGFYAVLKHCD